MQMGTRLHLFPPKLHQLTFRSFFTQTKPSASSPFALGLKTPAESTVSGSSPSLTSTLVRTGPRKPLGELSFSEDLEHEGSPRLTRIKKRRLSLDDKDDDMGNRSSPSLSPAKPNAFDELMRGRSTTPKRAKRLDKSAFVEGEAEESDDDAMFGFGVRKQKDDEEDADGEDQDATLAELVDDAVMDDAVLNEAKVLEKVKSVFSFLSPSVSKWTYVNVYSENIKSWMMLR